MAENEEGKAEVDGEINAQPDVEIEPNSVAELKAQDSTGDADQESEEAAVANLGMKNEEADLGDAEAQNKNTAAEEVDPDPAERGDVTVEQDRKQEEPVANGEAEETTEITAAAADAAETSTGEEEPEATVESQARPTSDDILEQPSEPAPADEKEAVVQSAEQTPHSAEGSADDDEDDEPPPYEETVEDEEASRLLFGEQPGAREDPAGTPSTEAAAEPHDPEADYEYSERLEPEPVSEGFLPVIPEDRAVAHSAPEPHSPSRSHGSRARRAGVSGQSEEEMLGVLEAMGFDRDLSLAALLQTNGSLQAAIELLAEGNRSAAAQPPPSQSSQSDAEPPADELSEEEAQLRAVLELSKQEYNQQQQQQQQQPASASGAPQGGGSAGSGGEQQGASVTFGDEEAGSRSKIARMQQSVGEKMDKGMNKAATLLDKSLGTLKTPGGMFSSFTSGAKSLSSKLKQQASAVSQGGSKALTNASSLLKDVREEVKSVVTDTPRETKVPLWPATITLQVKGNAQVQALRVREKRIYCTATISNMAKKFSSLLKTGEGAQNEGCALMVWEEGGEYGRGPFNLVVEASSDRQTVTAVTSGDGGMVIAEVGGLCSRLGKPGEAGRLMSLPQRRVTVMAWAKEYLVAGTADGSVKSLQLGARKGSEGGFLSPPVGKGWEGAVGAGVVGMGVGPGGREVVVTLEDDSVHLVGITAEWEGPRTKKLVNSVFGAGGQCALAVDQQGGLVVTGGQDSRVVVWALVARELSMLMRLPGTAEAGAAVCVCWCGTKRAVAVGFGSGWVMVWDLRDTIQYDSAADGAIPMVTGSADPSPTIIRAHDGPITAIAWDEKRTGLWTAGAGSVVRMFGAGALGFEGGGVSWGIPQSDDMILDGAR